MQREIDKNTWKFAMLVDESKYFPAQIAAYKAIKDEEGDPFCSVPCTQLYVAS